jgi:hypothetical protein
MNNELMVTLESRTNIQGFRELSSELASALRNHFEEFEEVNVEEFWVSGVSLNNVINILEAGTIIFNYYDIDFTDEYLLSSIFTRINEIKDAVIGILKTDFNNMNIRLNFEWPNTIGEITQKLQVLERTLAKGEIRINGINMRRAEKIGGPYKALEVAISY